MFRELLPLSLFLFFFFFSLLFGFLPPDISPAEEKKVTPTLFLILIIVTSIATPQV